MELNGHATRSIFTRYDDYLDNCIYCRLQWNYNGFRTKRDSTCLYFALIVSTSLCMVGLCGSSSVKLSSNSRSDFITFVTLKTNQRRVVVVKITGKWFNILLI